MAWEAELLTVRMSSGVNVQVKGWRFGTLAVHPRVSEQGPVFAHPGRMSVHDGHILTHLPTGCIVACARDFEELEALGESLLKLHPLAMRKPGQVLRVISPIYKSLKALGRWPADDLARRLEEGV